MSTPPCATSSRAVRDDGAGPAASTVQDKGVDRNREREGGQSIALPRAKKYRAKKHGRLYRSDTATPEGLIMRLMRAKPSRSCSLPRS